MNKSEWLTGYWTCSKCGKKNPMTLAGCDCDNEPQETLEQGVARLEKQLRSHSHGPWEQKSSPAIIEEE